jgi:uncharacterized protein (TIGR03435 family)
MSVHATDFIVSTVLLSACSTALVAQSAETVKSPVRFEVASVRPHSSDDQREMFVAQPGGRLLALNVTLRHVIRTAFQVQEDQIVGGPDWLGTDRFDIEARAADMPGAPTPELLEMLRSLLTDRFALQTHREMREIAVFALVRAGRDGELGPELRPTACPDLAIDLSRPKPCANVSTGFGALNVRGMPFGQLTQFLSPYIERVLIDRTGLDGRYDFTLRWSPEQTPGAAATPAPPIGNPDRPSIYTALQEQLGLKLESTREQVEVLVIDSVQHPAPN